MAEKDLLDKNRDSVPVYTVCIRCHSKIMRGGSGWRLLHQQSDSNDLLRT